MLELKNITKNYQAGAQVVPALKGISISFRQSEFVAILGPSGCGKTTLLNIVGGLDRYTTGDLLINGISTKKYKDKDWDTYRNHEIGFVFQSYNLIPHLTVLENVELSLTISGIKKEERKRRAIEALKRVGLEDQLRKLPNQLSGGQMQRVAIARALVLNPEILLCDEATSALDPQITRDILNLLLKINKEMNITIVVVTHQMEVIKQICNKVAFLKDGRVLSVGKPEELFVAPNQELQKFVGDDIEILPQTGKNIKLFFTNNNSKSHTITQLARTLDINFDICQGKLENFRGSMMGSLIINIDEKDLQAVGNYLDQEKITWEEIV